MRSGSERGVVERRRDELRGQLGTSDGAHFAPPSALTGTMGVGVDDAHVAERPVDTAGLIMSSAGFG